MSGLLYLIAGYIYWVISSFLTRSAASAAKKKGVSGWKWGLPVAIIMYHLVFWDLIPTFVTLQYSCMTEGGYWIYKTPEQWKIENPSLAKTLNLEPDKSLLKNYWVKTEGLNRFYLLPNGTELIAHYDVRNKYMYTDMQHTDGTKSSWLNQHFGWEAHKNHFSQLKYLRREEQKIVDQKSGEIMAHYIGFNTNIGGAGISWDGIKFWQVGWECSGDIRNSGALRRIRNEFRILGEPHE